MRPSCALVLPALVCILCATTPSAPRVAASASSDVVQQARAASQSGQNERAASLWEQVLATNPSNGARMRALWGAAEARLASPGSGRNTQSALRHVQALVNQAGDGETHRALLLTLRALDWLSAPDHRPGELPCHSVEGPSDSAQLAALLLQPRRQIALGNPAAHVLEPRQPGDDVEPHLHADAERQHAGDDGNRDGDAVGSDDESRDLAGRPCDSLVGAERRASRRRSTSSGGSSGAGPGLARHERTRSAARLRRLSSASGVCACRFDKDASSASSLRASSVRWVSFRMSDSRSDTSRQRSTSWRCRSTTWSFSALAIRSAARAE